MKLLKALLVAGSLLGTIQASAATVTFHWNAATDTILSSDSGQTPTANPGSIFPDYLQVTFKDGVSANTVEMIITANMTSITTVDTISFNIQPDSLANALTIVDSDPVIQGLTSKVNQTKAGPIHTFDLKLDTGEGQVNSVGPIEIASVTFGLTSGTGLNALSFNVANADGYYAAAHFQNLNGNQNLSAWIASGPPDNGTGGPGDAVPLPAVAPAALLLIGGLGLRRTRKIAVAD